MPFFALIRLLIRYNDWLSIEISTVYQLNDRLYEVNFLNQDLGYLGAQQPPPEINRGPFFAVFWAFFALILLLIHEND